MDKVSKIMSYEDGELNDFDALKLFSELIKSGAVWTLQGHYGRTATALIEANWIFPSGKLNKQKIEDNGIEG